MRLSSSGFVCVLGLLGLAAASGCTRPHDACCGQPAGAACAGPMDPGGGVHSAINIEPPRSGAVGANTCTSPAVLPTAPNAPTAIGGGPRAADDVNATPGGTSVRETSQNPSVDSTLRTTGSPRRMEY